MYQPLQPQTTRQHTYLSQDTWQRLNAARLRADLTWDEFLARLA